MARIEPVRDWLKALGVLTAASMSPADAKAKIAAYAPMLVNEFPDYCFTPASLAAVARSCKFFPTFGELSSALGSWEREHRPAGAYDVPRLAAPVQRAPQEAELEADRLDREWWEDRIDRIARMSNATEAWREAMGMRELLTRPTTHPRQWAVDRLTAIIGNTASAGADTDLSAVQFAPTPKIATEPEKTYYQQVAA